MYLWWCYVFTVNHIPKHGRNLCKLNLARLKQLQKEDAQKFQIEKWALNSQKGFLFHIYKHFSVQAEKGWFHRSSLAQSVIFYVKFALLDREMVSLE